MKKVILLSFFLSSAVFAGQELDMLQAVDNTFLDGNRGMGQENTTGQGGLIAGNDMSNSITLTGSNQISAGALAGANGIIMVNLSSGNNNITNMSTSVNIVSAR